MGGNQSVQVDPALVTAEQVASYLVSKSPVFEKYTDAILRTDINGEVLMDTNDDEVDELLVLLAVENIVDKKKFKAAFKEFIEFKTIFSMSPSVSAGALSSAQQTLQDLSLSSPQLPPVFIGGGQASAQQNVQPQSLSALLLPIRTGKQTHVFLTHNWATDERGRNNHLRVMAVNNALKALGFITWFDDERMQGSIRRLMTEGVDLTLVMLTFVTKDYMEKVNGEDERDNCRYEFTYGVEVLGPQNFVPIVTEPRMRDNKTWTGEFGAALRTKLYVDFSEDFPNSCVPSELMNQLVAQIMSRPNMSTGALAPAASSSKASSLDSDNAVKEVAEIRARDELEARLVALLGPPPPSPP